MTEALFPTETQIEDLVATFYARIRKHPTLGPIFLRVIGPEWGPHSRVMCDFWTSVMLTTGKFIWRPILSLVKFTGISPEDFTQKQKQNKTTAKDLFAPSL